MTAYSGSQFECPYRDQEPELLAGVVQFVTSSIRPELPGPVYSGIASRDRVFNFRVFSESSYPRRVPVPQTVPSEVADFILHIYARGQFPCYTLVQAALFLRRFFVLTSPSVCTASTWRLLLLVATIAADKMLEDRSVKTSAGAQLFPLVTKLEMAAIEKTFLKIFDHNMRTASSVEFLAAVRDFVKIGNSANLPTNLADKIKKSPYIAWTQADLKLCDKLSAFAKPVPQPLLNANENAPGNAPPVTAPAAGSATHKSFSFTVPPPRPLRSASPAPCFPFAYARHQPLQPQQPPQPPHLQPPQLQYPQVAAFAVRPPSPALGVALPTPGTPGNGFGLMAPMSVRTSSPSVRGALGTSGLGQSLLRPPTPLQYERREPSVTPAARYGQFAQAPVIQVSRFSSGVAAANSFSFPRPELLGPRLRLGNPGHLRMASREACLPARETATPAQAGTGSSISQ